MHGLVDFMTEKRVKIPHIRANLIFGKNHKTVAIQGESTIKLDKGK